MKVLLINPPQQHELRGSLPDAVGEGRGYNPPLGLLYVASFLEKRTNHAVTVLDCPVERIDHAALEAAIRKFNPTVVGITTLTLGLIDSLQAAATVKQIDSTIKVVLGGPHVHLYPTETINQPNIDFLVLGEGEEIFAELLDALENNKQLARICGLVFKEADQVVNTGMRMPITDISRLPFPAREKTPYKEYSSILALRSPVTTLITSRGCPFQCAFCDRKHLGKIFRFVSARNVVDELQACVKLGIRDFLFYDDTFTINKSRVIEICMGILNRRLDISWDIRARVDTVDDEMLLWLKKAGCHGIHYGVEAGTEKILRALNKGISLDKVRQTFALTKKHKLLTLAYFMIGNPTETKADIEATFDFAKELNPNYIHLSILCPFPGTKIYAQALERGIIKSDCWREFAQAPKKDFLVPYWCENFSRKELEAWLVLGYKKFYSRPKYLWRSLIKIKNLSELKRKFRAGLKIISMKNRV